VATDRTQHLRAEAGLVLTEQAEDAGKPADAGANLGEEFSRSTAAELVQVFSTTLQVQPGDRIEVCHRDSLSASR
jgi:hypothetical protein